MEDIRQTPEYAKYMKSIGWVVEKKNNTYFYIKKFPIVGSFMKLQRPEKIDFKKVNSLAKKYRVFQIIIEPLGEIKEYKLSKSPFLPSKTIELDLTKSETQLFNQLKKDCKYSLRKTEKLEVKEEKDIQKFRRIWKQNVPKSRYVMSTKNLNALKKSFKSNMLLLQCIDTLQQPIAGGVFLVAGNKAYYWQGFSGKKGRKSLAQYKIVWEGILWAKRMKANRFDFEGIYDDRFPQKSWAGFSEFKKKFGGEIITYPGAYSRWRFPLQ